MTFMEPAVQQTLDILKLLLTRMLPVLFIITFFQEKGLLKKLDKLGLYIVKWTAFTSITGQAFIANLGSVYAGSGMLVNLFKDKQISRSNLILSVVFAAFPAHLRITLSSTGPVVFSLFTFPVALFYVCISLLDATLKLLTAGILSFLLLSKEKGVEFDNPSKDGMPVVISKSVSQAFWAASKKRFIIRGGLLFLSP
ncbi:MAG: hypothetical protein OMM_03637 [Candidatus Magnetoglobus multicellularis str. Araruama]|uniref:Nucleoside transporter/FeoB GTPase Gate domain-containing protein n=1 Tax=Candidatus Magnetoglobus multicellularis str. Araruama TaxID=890399 RepID=A0A1V1P4Q9_9BACT|nr:MAG: hypothetical protein OMM_03637 [Candidatus Magnetoglobus multicellularis str. Araruama]